MEIPLVELAEVAAESDSRTIQEIRHDQIQGLTIISAKDYHSRLPEIKRIVEAMGHSQKYILAKIYEDEDKELTVVLRGVYNDTSLLQRYALSKDEHFLWVGGQAEENAKAEERLSRIQVALKEMGYLKYVLVRVRQTAHGEFVINVVGTFENREIMSHRLLKNDEELIWVGKDEPIVCIE